MQRHTLRSPLHIQAQYWHYINHVQSPLPLLEQPLLLLLLLNLSTDSTPHRIHTQLTPSTRCQRHWSCGRPQHFVVIRWRWSRRCGGWSILSEVEFIVVVLIGSLAIPGFANAIRDGFRTYTVQLEDLEIVDELFRSEGMRRTYLSATALGDVGNSDEEMKNLTDVDILAQTRTQLIRLTHFRVRHPTSHEEKQPLPCLL